MQCLSVLVLAPLFLTTRAQTDAELCLPDSTCNRHRIDMFGSLAAYDVARRALYNASGCSEACINQCTCVCNTTGIVFEELNQKPTPPYCLKSVVCRNKVIQAMMDYDAEGYQCEKVTVIALRSVYQLCANIKNKCGDGACDAAWCSDSVSPIGEQNSGIPSSIRAAMFFYVITGSMLFFLAISTSVYYRDTVVPHSDDDDEVEEGAPLLPKPEQMTTTAAAAFARTMGGPRYRKPAGVRTVEASGSASTAAPADDFAAHM